MAEVKRQHELSDVYAAFGERCPKELLEPEKDESKENLNIDKKSLTTEMRDLGEKAAEDFDSIKKGHPSAVKRHTDEVSVESTVYQTQQSQGNSAISFSAEKRFRKENVKEGEIPFLVEPHKDEVEILVLNVDASDAGNRKQVGNIDLLHEKNGEWNLSDRFVDKRFRGQGMAKALLVGAESFVQKYADKTKTSQTVSLELSQPSVLVTFLNAGYTAETEEDQKRIDAMLSGASELYLSFIERPDGGGRLDFLDACCFDSGKVPRSAPDNERTPYNSYRIKLVKKFQPKNSAVDEGIMHFGKYMTW